MLLLCVDFLLLPLLQTLWTQTLNDPQIVWRRNSAGGTRRASQWKQTGAPRPAFSRRIAEPITWAVCFVKGLLALLWCVVCLCRCQVRGVMGGSLDVEGHSMIISFVLEVLRARCCRDTPHPDVPPPACTQTHCCLWWMPPFLSSARSFTELEVWMGVQSWPRRAQHTTQSGSCSQGEDRRGMILFSPALVFLLKRP